MRSAITPNVQKQFAQAGKTIPLQILEKELLKCVHCGMCNATCPTYQIRADELDGPRGRIYQIKNLIEGATLTASHRLHLDRCLLCRACETTCPSGVRYHHILEIGRWFVDDRHRVPHMTRLKRWALGWLSHRQMMQVVFALARQIRPLLSLLPISSLYQKIPISKPFASTTVAPDQIISYPVTDQKKRTFILMQGCVQPGMLPNIHQATIRVFQQLGITLMTVSEEQCCGGIMLHLNKEQEASKQMIHNLQCWHHHMKTDPNIEGIIINATGCEVIVKEYAETLATHALSSDIQQMLTTLSNHVFDPIVLLSEYIETLKIRLKGRPPPLSRVVFQSSCTLQHGLQLGGHVEHLLTQLGLVLPPVAEAHICCGSAGTYSILQPQMASTLRERKLKHLLESQPEAILTAHVGCYSHLQANASVPIWHYLEFLDAWLATPIQPYLLAQ